MFSEEMIHCNLYFRATSFPSMDVCMYFLLLKKIFVSIPKIMKLYKLIFKM